MADIRQKNEELNKESQIEQLNSDELQSLKEEIEILKKNILERDEEKRDTLKEFDSLNKCVHSYTRTINTNFF